MKVLTIGAIGIAVALASVLTRTRGDRILIDDGPDNQTGIAEVEIAATAGVVLDPKLVAMWIVDPYDALDYSVSTDGGETWSAKDAFDPSSNVADPSITAAEDGTFVLTYLQMSGPRKIRAAVMPPNKTEFEQYHDVLTSVFTDFPRVISGPSAVNEGAEMFYITATPSYFASTDDPTTGWTVTTMPFTGEGPLVPAVADDGHVYVAYYKDVDPGLGEDFDYFMVKTDDDGDTFDDVTDFEVVVSADPATHRFDAYVPGDFRVPDVGDLAAHPTDGDRLYFVFNECADCPNTYGERDSNMDIFITRTLNGGTTWSEPVRVNQDSPPIGEEREYDQWLPRVAVDTSGRVHIVWYDIRNDPRANNTATSFEIECFYIWALDDGDPLEFDSAKEILLGGVAIDTGDLVDDEFIGDYIGLAYDGGLVAPAFLATTSQEKERIVTHLITSWP